MQILSQRRTLYLLRIVSVRVIVDVDVIVIVEAAIAIAAIVVVERYGRNRRARGVRIVFVFGAKHGRRRWRIGEHRRPRQGRIAEMRGHRKNVLTGHWERGRRWRRRWLRHLRTVNRHHLRHQLELGTLGHLVTGSVGYGC